MGSIEEEDLTSSLDFEFYDFGGHKEENVTFNKVYNKPPPGRQHHRSISVPNNKVCYENSTYNGTNNKNNDYQPRECNGLDELESNRCQTDSVLLMNGVRKVEDRHFYKTTTRNEEEDDEDRQNGLFVSLEQEENDLQSGLDVSISDDTEDEEEDGDIYKNDDLFVDEITDDEDEDVGKKERSLGEDAAEEEVNNSGPDRSGNTKKKNIGLKRRKKISRSNNNLHGIVVPNLHNIHNASCSSGEASSSTENDDSDSDLSSLDDDDDEDCLCSDDGLKSTDEEDSNTNKSLGDGPTAPRRIMRKGGLSSFEERFPIKHKSKRDNNHISSSSPEKGDMNCNNIDDDDEDCSSSSSSASEMTDVSPLASSAENSPTISRKSKPSPRNLTTSDTIITVCSGKNSSITTTTQNGKNGFSCNKKTSDMDMNLIMQAVEEISKEDDEKWKRRCSSKISSSSSSSSPIRKRNNNNRTNMTYTNERAKQIEKENERLLSQLLKLSSSASTKSFNKVGNRKLPLKSKVSHSAINRQREQRRIDKENEAFLRRLQSAKPSNGISRDDQLEEYNSKHLKCPRTKSTRNNGSPFKRPFTATSSSGRNSIISLATDTNNSIGLSKRNVCHHQSTPTNNRPEWVTKW